MSKDLHQTFFTENTKINVGAEIPVWNQEHTEIIDTGVVEPMYDQQGKLIAYTLRLKRLHLTNILRVLDERD